jgi:hypothetical protein
MAKGFDAAPAKHCEDIIIVGGYRKKAWLTI